jgi:hypothetical protein
MSPPIAPRRSPTSRRARADQHCGALHAAPSDDSRAPAPAHHPRPDGPYLAHRGNGARRATAPLAAVGASAEAAAEAAAGLLLSAAALAADTLAAVLSPIDLAAEVMTRAADCYRDSDRERIILAGPSPGPRPGPRPSSRGS